MNCSIVVPSIRESNLRDFLAAWRSEFTDCEIIVIEDNPERTFVLNGPNIAHFSWKDIDMDLKEKAWIIPRRTDCIRSYGFYKAYCHGADVIITLDDDCHPDTVPFVTEHVARLSAPVRERAWVTTISGLVPRGVPYFVHERETPVAINHGLWNGVPDLDAITQLISRRVEVSSILEDKVIPRSCYFPMCGMNVAFIRTFTPIMYFLLMGTNYPYDRFGDIWCGIIAKKICDHLGYSIRSGKPFVYHSRASDVWTNLAKECAGYQANEEFWRAVDSVVLTYRTPLECYIQLAKELPLTGDYWDKMRKAMLHWAELFV